MKKDDFLDTAELKVNPNEEGGPSDHFVKVGGWKPEKPKKKADKKGQKGDTAATDKVFGLIGNLSDDDAQKVLAALNKRFETKGTTEPETETEEAENPATLESGSRYSFDGEYKNDDKVAVVVIVDEEAEKAKKLAEIRKMLQNRYDKSVLERSEAQQAFKDPILGKIYIDALTAQSDFIYHVLMHTNDAEWLVKTLDQIKSMYSDSVEAFLEDADTYPITFGHPTDMDEYIVRRYLTEYFFTKRKFIEGVLKQPGDDFKAKLVVFKFKAKQKAPEPENPKVRPEPVKPKPVETPKVKVVQVSAKPAVINSTAAPDTKKTSLFTSNFSSYKAPSSPAHGYTEVPNIGRVNNLALDFASTFFGN